jgi:hypothetical protein
VNGWASALACREWGGREQREARSQQGWRLGDDEDKDGLHCGLHWLSATGHASIALTS